MNGFTDMHAHFVYGVDDGAADRQTMEKMLDAAHREGVTSLYATSHATPGIKPFPKEKYQRHLAEARAYCTQKKYAMTIYSGAENMYTPAFNGCAEDGRLITLGSSDFVLVEFLPDIPVQDIERTVDVLERNGYAPILAHIERYVNLRGSAAYHLKKKHDVLFQVNCGTVIHKNGFFVDRRVAAWFKNHLIDFVASDFHDCSRRPTKMKTAHHVLMQKYGTEYADQLMNGFQQK